MHELNVLIVDDERKSREALVKLLEEYCPEAQVVGMAANVKEAADSIAVKKPDIVFLDILMPGGNGFQLLEQFSPLPFNVIFTTSYHEYAIQAIRFAAIDYLLKPVLAEELKTAVNNARKRYPEQDHEKRMELLRKNLSDGIGKIALPTLEGFHFISVDEIEFCEADNNYTHFYLADRNHILVSKTLKDAEALLTSRGFFRIHQSYLVNMKFIRKFIKGTSSLITTSGKELPVSIRRRDEFLHLLKKL